MSRRLAPVTLATILVAEWNSSKPANRRLKSFPYDLRDAIAEAIAEERAELEDARAEVERLRWGNEMACENTPTRDCECPGCAVARARADDGATGPSPWEYRCQSCGANLAEVVVDGVKLPRVERCDDCVRERAANEP